MINVCATSQYGACVLLPLGGGHASAAVWIMCQSAQCCRPRLDASLVFSQCTYF